MTAEKMFEKIDIAGLLKEFADLCMDKFGSDLVSIVLFGSYARGTATEYSDIDLLVIVNNVSEDWRERDKVLGDIELYFLKEHHKRMFPILTTPEAVADSVRIGNPLFYGILRGYSILFDRNSFFKKLMQKVLIKVKVDKPIFYDKEGRWELAKI